LQGREKEKGSGMKLAQIKQTGNDRICIQIRGRVKKAGGKAELEALLRMLEYVCGEAEQYGYIECERHIFLAMEELRLQMEEE
jgi:hypothetical protein